MADKTRASQQSQDQKSKLVLILKHFILVLVCIFVTGCAGIPPGTERLPDDPWEPFNRSIFIFNEGLDDYLLRPVTKGYRFVLPRLAQQGVDNFFGNYRDFYTMGNNLLQGNLSLATNDFMRVVINSVFGLAGFIDVATPAGLEKHRADFGQTFGVWGIPSGPYVVLPIFGPSSLRDTFGTAADLQTDYLFRLLPNVHLRNSLTILRIINARNDYYETGELFEGAAIDKYTFARDAYIQRRQYQINQAKDGEEQGAPIYENLYE
jgi:phospholipid-binding lipoprotein MlaA